jgi:hypothetical protein
MMTGSRSLLAGVLVPAMLLISGCLDVNVRTSVSSDGSSERTIMTRTNSKSVPPGMFPVATDSSWKVEWKETDDKENRYEYIAGKQFANPDELRREYARLSDTGAVGIDVMLEKRFQWFYTYLDYRETYIRREPGLLVPLTQFMTEEEINRYVYGDKSDSLKKKIDEWTGRNMFEQIYRPMVDEAARLNNPALPSALLEEKKETIYAAIVKADTAGRASGSPDSTRKGVDTPDDVLRVMREELKIPAVELLRPVIVRAWEKLESDAGGEKKTPDSWTCTVQMPGILLGTNSTIVEGNSVTWKFGADQIRAGHFIMRASSRVANVWAFVVSGFVVIIAIGAAVWGRVRRRPSASDAG